MIPPIPALPQNLPQIEVVSIFYFQELKIDTD